MSDYVQVENAVIKAVTKRAALVYIDGSDRWIPLSCISEEDLDQLEVGLVLELSVVEWFYNKEIGF